jgi:ABC-type Mn2+/Zn2+ transport system permease subunit
LLIAPSPSPLFLDALHRYLAVSAILYELECLIGLLLNPYYFCSPATPVICLFRPPAVQFHAP